MSETNKQYEKPVFKCAPRFDFTPKVADGEGGYVVGRVETWSPRGTQLCRSCSSCHGCR